MEILIGLLIIAIGSFCQSSSYVPIKKVKEWSWESFWLIQGVFAWLVFPFLGSLLGVPQESSLFDLWGAGGAGMSIFYGILWGVGGLTFGLSMRYLGVALGQSISLGTCAGFGTLLPALFAGTNLFEGNGLILLLGVCITLAGIAIIGYAGSLRAQNMSEEEKRCRKRLCIDKRVTGCTFGWCHECLLCFGTGCGNTYQRSRFGWWSGRTLCRSSGYLSGYAWRLPDKCSLLFATECG